MIFQKLSNIWNPKAQGLHPGESELVHQGNAVAVRVRLIVDVSVVLCRHDVVFIHPKGNDEFPIGGCGVLVELVQAPQEVIDAHDN